MKRAFFAVIVAVGTLQGAYAQPANREALAAATELADLFNADIIKQSSQQVMIAIWA